jgi:ketosteroid isomerase-like protein
MTQLHELARPHPMAEKIQKGFEATMHGELNALRALYADDFVCHVPGRCDLSGDLHGYDEVVQWFTRIVDRSGGTFQEESLAVVADDDWAFQLTTFHAEREGNEIRGRSVNTYRIRDGRIAEVWAFFDTEAWDEFWTHTGDAVEQRREVLDYV